MIPLFLTEQLDAVPNPQRSYLWPLLPKNSLIVREVIFYQNPTVEELKTTLPYKPGTTIFLDLSENPEDLTNPSAQHIIDKLRQIGPVKIIVNEYKKFYNPEPDIIFFNPFFYTYGHNTYLGRYVSRLPDFEEKTRPFMSLNNRPIWSRIWLFTELVNADLLEKIDYSFVWDPKTWTNDHLELLPAAKKQQALSMLHLLPIKFESEKTMNFIADIHCYLDCYRQCAVNIVTESAPNLGFLSEKICKPLGCYQIPILISHRGATQFCVDAGFDMFEDIIPWKKWDDIVDDQERTQLVCDFVIDYVKNGNALEDWKRCRHRVIANRQRIESSEFRKFWEDQLLVKL